MDNKLYSTILADPPWKYGKGWDSIGYNIDGKNIMDILK